METLDDIKKNTDHPSHYGGADNPYEAIKVLHEWGLDKDAYLWNTGKYLSRAGHKDGNSLLQDLTKARWYLDYKIRLLTEQQKIAESVVDTLKKMPEESVKELTTMPDESTYIPKHGKSDDLAWYVSHAVPYNPNITPNIETAVVPECTNEIKF